MEGKRFIHRLRLKNLLSFGPEGVDIELEPLNVLIGPNASGKSNFIEAISLLQALPDDLTVPIREGGGIEEWLWKNGGLDEVALMSVTVHPPAQALSPLEHSLGLQAMNQRVWVERESIESGSELVHLRSTALEVLGHILQGAVPESLPPSGLRWDQSILAQWRDPDPQKPITYLGQQYGRIHLYREWNLGRFAEPRQLQRADLPADFLWPDASNVALVWDYLKHQGVGDRMTDELRRFYPAVRKVDTLTLGGTIQVYVQEEGLRRPIPAVRLSDGTLRYLCLLTILCHPDPPPLVCIEEPELGLHPDIIPRVAELLVEASSRMQLVVTTHSSELVDALSDTPEAVVVCERDEGGTRLQRLNPERLRKWLKDYTLGHLWSMGEIGGNLY